MKLYCNYVDVFELDELTFDIYYVWSNYPFGTNRVSCAWCQNTNCDTYGHCTSKCDKTDHRLCKHWRMDIP